MVTRAKAVSVAVAIGAIGVQLAIGCAKPDDEPVVSAAGFFFPEGDAAAGREVFVSMGCYSCHEVPGETFPAPVARPPVPVPLDSTVTQKTREQLAESILAPSHAIRLGAEDVDAPELSRMGDYTEALTVADLIGLVTYLKSLSAL
jgi:hypothetical protein